MTKTPTPLDLRVGSAIRFWRAFDHRSQSQVAFHLHCERTAISGWERGHNLPRLGAFLEIAEALRVSPYMLALTAEAFA